MEHPSLHIIAFAIPYPPNYGGVIDVFYKIKALHAQGVRIILHCFEYQRERSPEVEALCEKVYYYKRSIGWKNQLSLLPYVVLSRKNEELLNNLLKDNHPILFEALHTCYYLQDKRLRNRLKIYRESNIEHHYYRHLAKAETGSCKKRWFYLVESWKLYLFQKILKHADVSLVVSREDYRYLKNHFPDKDIRYLPSFQENDQVSSLTGRGDYVLYHGNLSVNENEKAAFFLIEEVFGGTEIPFVVAGLSPSPKLMEAAKRHSNIRLVASPSHNEMTQLIKDAHINVLVTFQATGLKLKLLNALYTGRFCLANKEMLAGTGLETLCVVASNVPDAIRAKALELLGKDFTEEEKAKRTEVLGKHYSNRRNAEEIIHIISPLRKQFD